MSKNVHSAHFRNAKTSSEPNKCHRIKLPTKFIEFRDNSLFFSYKNKADRIEFIHVHVDYIKTSLKSFGDWSGYGYTTDFIDIGSYETNICSIVINYIKIEPAETYFTFQGNGIPKGELAEIINK